VCHHKQGAQVVAGHGSPRAPGELVVQELMPWRAEALHGAQQGGECVEVFPLLRWHCEHAMQPRGCVYQPALVISSQRLRTACSGDAFGCWHGKRALNVMSSME
jgi:hypothetical protein